MARQGYKLQCFLWLNCFFWQTERWMVESKQKQQNIHNKYFYARLFRLWTSWKQVFKRVKVGCRLILYWMVLVRTRNVQQLQLSSFPLSYTYTQWLVFLILCDIFLWSNCKYFPYTFRHSSDILSRNVLSLTTLESCHNQIVALIWSPVSYLSTTI